MTQPLIETIKIGISEETQDYYFFLSIAFIDVCAQIQEINALAMLNYLKEEYSIHQLIKNNKEFFKEKLINTIDMFHQLPRTKEYMLFALFLNLGYLISKENPKNASIKIIDDVFNKHKIDNNTTMIVKEAIYFHDLIDTPRYQKSILNTKITDIVETYQERILER